MCSYINIVKGSMNKDRESESCKDSVLRTKVAGRLRNMDAQLQYKHVVKEELRASELSK